VLILPFINGPIGKPIKASTTVRLLAKLQPPRRASTNDDTCRTD
jgi:hypothetical protein